MMTNGLVVVLAAFVLGPGEPKDSVDSTPVEVVLIRGDRLHGKLIGQDQYVLTLDHPVLGCLEIDRADVAVILDPAAVVADPDSPPRVDGPGRSPQAGRLPGVQPISWEMLPPALRPPRPPTFAESAWTGSLGAALTASRTTVSTYNLRLSGQVGRQNERERTNLTVSYYLNTADGDVTDNDLLARGDQNWYMQDSRLEFFLQTTYQYDQFEEWAHRLSPYGGLGWRLVDEPEGSLTLKAGAGATWEDTQGVVRPQALGEMTGSWNFGEQHSVRGYASIAPSVEDLADYLATIKIDWDIRLSRSSPLALNLGIRTIYDSTPGPGSTTTDFKAWAGLNWSF